MRVAGGAQARHSSVPLQLRHDELHGWHWFVAFRNVPIGHTQVPFSVKIWSGKQAVQAVGSKATEQSRQLGSQAAQKPLAVNRNAGLVQVQL